MYRSSGTRKMHVLFEGGRVGGMPEKRRKREPVAFPVGTGYPARDLGPRSCVRFR